MSRYLKEVDPRIQVFLIDPPGSALYGRVVHGVLFSNEEREGRRKRVGGPTVHYGARTLPAPGGSPSFVPCPALPMDRPVAPSGHDHRGHRDQQSPHG